MTRLDSILQSRGIIFPTKVYLVKSMYRVRYRGESWTIKNAKYRGESWTRKKANLQRIDGIDMSY